MMVVVEVKARAQLRDGYWWYEKQDPGAGDYFLRSLYAEIESLPRYAGIHRKVLGHHRLITAVFPFSIYYSIQGETILVKAILDNRHSRVRTIKKPVVLNCPCSIPTTVVDKQSG